MEKCSKKRKKPHAPDGEKIAKKVRFSFAEDTGKRDASDPPRKQKAAVAAVAAEESPEHNTSLSDLRETISVWMQKQAVCNQSDLDELRQESDNEECREDDIDVASIEKPMRHVLRGLSEEEKRKSFKLECEWGKCKYMKGTDRKYFLHVESHAETALKKQNSSYTCEWDLCDFITDNRDEFMGHVHYHAYHTKLKVHGASMHMLMKLPSCNNDSRVRNTITNRPVTFRCDWVACNERFNKAMNFFHHVANHVVDQFEPGKRSSAVPLACGWSLCKKLYKTAQSAFQHVNTHTTERVIGCYTCGTLFCARLKLIDHCMRQVEITQRKYQCTECERCYATNTLLKSHIEHHYKSHPCTMCPLKFSSAGILTQHMARKHFKERNFKCQQCEYGAYSRKDLLAHLRKHDETKLFRCEEFGCNVACKTEHAFKKHISWHYNLPPTVYACHVCTDKTYSHAHGLSKHLQFVHNINRPPGMCRFRYKTDSDGAFRLGSYVDQKKQQAQANEAPNRRVVSSDTDSSDTDASPKRRKPKRTTKQTRTMDQTVTDSHGDAYIPVEGKAKISSFKSIGLHEFSIELDIEPDPKQKLQSAPKPQAVVAAATVAAKPKEVKDFTVMKRYLKEEKTKTY